MGNFISSPQAGQVNPKVKLANVQATKPGGKYDCAPQPGQFNII